MRQYILVIDEGTTGTRALIFDLNFRVVSSSYTELTQYTPAQDRVEHDFEEIYEKTLDMCRKAMETAGLHAGEIRCIGITNQRNTVALWDRETGKPLRRGIVWQDTRAGKLLDQMKELPYMREAYRRCGRPFVTNSGNILLRWLMDNEPPVAAAIRDGRALYGTVDTWLVWKLTGGRVHAMSYSNASSLGIYDAVNNDWCRDYFVEADIPMGILPALMDENAYYGDTTVFGPPIPITGVIGDQHASLFGQDCREAGTAKCTNGTGAFMDIHIGEQFALPGPGLATMVAWSIDGKRDFLCEGMLPVTGSAIQWLRDGMGLVSSYTDAYEQAQSVPDSGGVFFVITLAGAYLPQYDPYARGALFGINPGTTRAHVVRATLEGIAFGIADILAVLERREGFRMRSVKMDGGASQNDLLAQMCADFIRCEVHRCRSGAEATALGAAKMAAVGAGIYTPETLPKDPVAGDVFRPLMSEETSLAMLERYRKAVARSAGWLR